MPDLPGSRKNQNETVIPKKISANKISATQKNKVTSSKDTRCFSTFVTRAASCEFSPPSCELPSCDFLKKNKQHCRYT